SPTVLPPSMPSNISKLQTQTITRSRAVLQLDLRLHLPVRRRPQHGARDDSHIPFRKLFRGHGQLAGSKQPARSFLGSHAQGTKPVAHVARGVGFSERMQVNVVDSLHAQRRKQVLLQEL